MKAKVLSKSTSWTDVKYNRVLWSPNKTNGIECASNVFVYFPVFHFYTFFQETEDTISVNTLH